MAGTYTTFIKIFLLLILIPENVLFQMFMMNKKKSLNDGFAKISLRMLEKNSLLILFLMIGIGVIFIMFNNERDGSATNIKEYVIGEYT